MIKLGLRNFKGVLEGTIELPDVSILVGGNNSGKSTILEAIFLAPDPFKTTLYGGWGPAITVVGRIHESLEARGYAFLLNKYSVDEAEISLTVNGVENHLFMVRGVHNIGFYTLTEGARYFYGSAGKFLPNYSQHPLASLDEFPDIREKFQKIDWVYPKIVETLLYHPSLMGLAWDGFSRRWVEVQPLTARVARWISLLSWEPIVNITLEPFGGQAANFTLYALLEDGSRIRVGDLGDGAKNLLTLMLLYELSKPKILLIDDLESHMNPRALDMMLDWLSEEVDKGLRLVASTHSLDVAKRFLSRLEGSKAVLLGLKAGKLSYKSFKLEELEELESSGLDVRVAEPYLL